MLQIDRGVPLPPAHRPPKPPLAGRKYPWHEMAVGDSFHEPRVATAQQMWFKIARIKRNRSRRWAVRAVAGGGVRVWRVG